MKNQFINADTVSLNKDVNFDKVDDFIGIFNVEISSGEETGDGSFCLNNGLDKDVPTLNDAEFEAAKELAYKAGWHLTSFDDNHNTTTYKLTKLITYIRNSF